MPRVASTGGRRPAGPAKPNRAEKARLTRERLFEAARELVGEEGYAETTIAKITSRAGIAQGTFYNYFESRQDILDQLLPTLGEDLLAFIRERVGQERDPVSRERTRLRAFFDFLVENPPFYRILNEAEMFAPRGFRRHMENMSKSYRQALARDRADGGYTPYEPREIEAVTYMLLAARNYLSMRYSYVDGRVQPVPAYVVEAYAKFVTEGLFSPSTGRAGSAKRGRSATPA
jgi:AcrR family transcriptional regulator